MSQDSTHQEPESEREAEERLSSRGLFGVWLPIESAPRDGTRILLWIEPIRIAMPFNWDGNRWIGDDYPLNMAWPTHWMPMPSAPNVQADLPATVDSASGKDVIGG